MTSGPRARLAAGALIAWLLLCAAAAPADSYKVVVHAGNPVTSLDRRQVAAFFMRRAAQWSDGTPVLPVDGPDAPARESFSKDVHGKKTAAVRSHWLQVIFSGRGVPPPEKAADEDVLAYVKAHPGAIGYVAAATPAPDVKVLRVEP